MVRRPSLTRLLSSRWTPLAVLVVGLACTAVAASELARSARERDQQRFENAAGRLAVAVDHRMEAYVALLRATGGMLDREGGYVDPGQFRAFLAAMRPEEFPGVQGIGYCRRIGQTELVKFTAEAQKAFAEGFAISPAEPRRPEYFPVIIVEPRDGPNARAIGSDLWFDPALRAAMERARDGGSAAAAEPVSLARAGGTGDGDAASPRGFVMFVPVFRKPPGAERPPLSLRPHRPTDVAGRRSLLAGFVAATFRADDLFAAVFPAPPTDATFAIRDAAAAGDAGLLYRSAGDDRPGARFQATVPIHVAGRTWMLAARSTPAFEAGLDRGHAAGAAVVGTAVSLVVALLVRLQVSARRAAEREHDAALRAERDARTAADRLELVLRGSGVGLWYSDLPLGRLHWDDRVKALFFLGGEPEPTVDKAFARIHPDDRDRTRAAMRAAVRALEPFDVEYRTVSPDGARTHWLRSIGQAFAGPDGQPGRVDVLTIDVSDLQSALSRAEAARESAEQAGRMKDDFLATLSHELRTPLNAIVGWAQLLRRGGPVAPEVDHGLAVIERNAKVQTRLVSDLLDMSRVVSGTLRVDAKTVDLSVVTAAAVESSRPAAEAKGLTVELAVERAAAGLTVRGDPARLQQVVWNLLTNAIKFTPRGGRVRLSLARGTETVSLTVADTGEGIAADFLPHVFDRFRQADATAARRHGGLGLGLAIVKQLVDLHGGRVWADSPGTGLGATFVVELPAVPLPPGAAAVGGAGAAVTPDVAPGGRFAVGDVSAPAPTGPADGNGDAAAAGDGKDGPAALAGLSVLSVDDEPDAREVVRRMLADAGARVLAAATAAEALDVLRRERPDVVVSDIGMVGQDGYALVRAIRQLPAAEGGQTPALALTAFARSEDCSRALLAGYQAHLAKPADRADLVRAVAALAGRAGAGAAVMN